MDATHLTQTVLAMKENGIDDLCFIHDSFGCPAGHIELMHRLLRETFVKLYSGNVLQDWYDQVMASLTPEEREGWELGGPPAQGPFVVEDTLQSDYFFA